ncbi:CsbD family protein [Histidinibacterium aquaticum]|uniref:CsbD family protein n=1 Tax=Histidinibacterium aquaticum TaxID=2613962 RepID=A0A5J5GPZ7_9RHOB|nr:CsbD family protein [Histidinibacterium aquaticum]KAA9010446.1 CsbD family protein [Histidinibacterium aquaticum]
MNWDQIQGQWKQFKGEALQNWGRLTNDDMDHAEGDQEKLEGIIQERYGKSKEEAHREVEDWISKREPH